MALYCKSAMEAVVSMPSLSVHMGFCEINSRSRSKSSLSTMSAE